MLRTVIKVMLFAAVLAAAMLAIRVLLIQPDEMALTCAQSHQWQCWLRDMAIQGFARNLYGWISMIAAMLAWLSGFSVFAVLAMAAGMAGAVLYDFDVAALGLLCGALWFVRGAANKQAAAE